MNRPTAIMMGAVLVVLLLCIPLSGYIAANWSDYVTGIVTGAISAWITAGFVYHHNSKAAYNEAVDQIICEMNDNMGKLQKFESNLKDMLRELKAGNEAWLPKYAAPRFNASGSYLYAYCDVKAFDSFILQGYSTRMDEGKFEQVSLFYNYCGRFNTDSQKEEEIMNLCRANLFPESTDTLNMAIEVHESEIRRVFERDYEKIEDAYRKFNPNKKEDLIDPNGGYPRWMGYLLSKFKGTE